LTCPACQARVAPTPSRLASSDSFSTLTFTDGAFGSSSLAALEFRRHGSAGTAPGHPEIRDKRDVTALGVTLEAPLVEADRMALKQLCLATAAGRQRDRTILRNAVDGVALETDSMNRLRYGPPPIFSPQSRLRLRTSM
jgi:hypothetical protein